MNDIWPLNSLAHMRRKEKHMNDPAAIAAVLHSADVLHLGMCDDGWPYVTPVNFVYDDGVILIHSARKGRKMDILRRNDRVCIQVETDTALVEPASPDNACQYTMRFKSVIGFGRAAIHTDTPTLTRGLAALMARYSSRPFRFPDAILDKTAIIAVRLDAVTGKQDGWG